MRRIAAILFVIATVAACKKKEEAKPQPASPAQTGDLVVEVVTYDSLGIARTDHSGVKVLLQNGSSLVTGTDGSVIFKNLSYNYYAPSLLLEGFDGPPVLLNLDARFKSFSLPFPQRSPFTIQTLSGDVKSADNWEVSYALDKPLPAGRVCVLAVLGHSVSGVTHNNYISADTICTSSTSGSRNFAALPSLKTLAESLKMNESFYVSLVPVSYGLYDSNLLGKKVPLGENHTASREAKLTKNW